MSDVFMTFGARYTSALPHGVAETKRTEGAQCHFESEGKVTKDERKGSEARREGKPWEQGWVCMHLRKGGRG